MYLIFHLYQPEQSQGLCLEEKKELDSLIHIEAMGKISEAVSSDQKIIWKLARAKKLFEKLDVDKSGHLSGFELNELADWVQHSLYPKGLFPDKVFSAADRASLLTEIQEKCDTSKDEKIDQKEFEIYYMSICKEVNEKNKERNDKIFAEKKEASDVAKKRADTIKEKMRAEKEEKRLH